MIGLDSAVVVDNKDPEGLHRVKVEFPSVDDRPPKSAWCRVASPMAGPDRGWALLPELGAEVVVGFAGQSGTPVVLGSLYNGKEEKPPYANKDAKNNLRLIWTRSGNQMVFDDTDGKEAIGIGAKATKVGDAGSGGVHQIMSDAKKIFTQKSDGDLQFDAVGGVTIRCTDFAVSAKGNLSIEATATSKLAGTSTTIEGKAKVGLTAAQVTLG